MAFLRSADPAAAYVDYNAQRLRRNVIVVGAGMAALGLVMIPLALTQNAPGFAPFALAILAALFLGAAGLARGGHSGLGATLIVTLSVGANLGAVAFDPATPSLPFFLVLATLLATVLLPPIHIWSILATCLVGNALIFALVTPERRTGEIWSEAIAHSSLLIVAVAVIGYLSASSVRSALREAQVARDEAEAARQALSASNTMLEHRVEERTVALRQIADEHRAAARALAASLQAQQDLNHIIEEQAIPVIPVSAGTIVVPLIGNVSTDRAGHILATILEHVERMHARTVVLDVTGVALVDTHVAGGLLRVAHATRLMGATTVLAGIRPEVAQALVGLGADLADLHTVATLAEAL